MMATLFDTEPETAVKSERLWVAEEIARHLTDRPTAHLLSITSLDLKHDGQTGIRFEVVDAPPTATGKRSGKPNWRKATNRQLLVISVEQYAAEGVAWEQRTGLCSICVGTGEEWIGWSAESGNRFKPCRGCAAGGAA